MLPLINNEGYSKDHLSFGFDFGFSFTVFGYKAEFAFDLFDWRFSLWEIMPIGISVWIGPFYFGMTDDTIHILDKPSKEEIAKMLVAELKNKNIILQNTLDNTREELEQERVRLAGCSVAAQGYGELLEPGTYGYSASYDDVRLLYIKYRQALKLIEKLRPKKTSPKHSHKAKGKAK